MCIVYKELHSITPQVSSIMWICNTNAKFGDRVFSKELFIYIFIYIYIYMYMCIYEELYSKTQSKKIGIGIAVSFRGKWCLSRFGKELVIFSYIIKIINMCRVYIYICLRVIIWLHIHLCMYIYLCIYICINILKFDRPSGSGWYKARRSWLHVAPQWRKLELISKV